MALFGRTTIDDPELKQLLAGRRVLASGRSPEGQVVGLSDRLLYPERGTWRQVAWHEILHGGWDLEASMLRWTSVDGIASSVSLTETGLLPDLFNERVTASIVCVRTVELAAGGTAVITARRNLGDTTAPLIWRVSPGKGVQRDTVDADPLAALELERLRAEYDLG